MSDRSSDFKWGIVLVILALFILLSYFGIFDIGDLFGIGIPLLLILWGVHLIRKSGHGDHRSSIGDKTVHASSSELDYSSTFGDVHLTVDNDDFSCGSVSNVFGDLTVDLRPVLRMADGAALEVRAVFGDIHIHLPPETAFEITSSSTFGALYAPDGSRIHTGVFKSAEFEGAERKLRLKISQVFSEARIHMQPTV